MRLFTAIILENEGFSLNDMTTMERMALKRVATGAMNFDNLSDKAIEVLDTLANYGLIDDLTYELTDDGQRAARLLDKYSKEQREDLSVAKQIAAAETENEMKNIRDDNGDFRGRENFRFTEGEKAVMKAAGLNYEEVTSLFLKEEVLGNLTHYVVDPRDKEMVTAFQLGKCENCKGDVQEANPIQIDIEGAKRLKLKRLDYLPAEVGAVDGMGTKCENCPEEEEEYEEDDYYDDDGEPHGSYDMSDDGDALASAGMGTDEDYGGYGGDDW